MKIPMSPQVTRPPSTPTKMRRPGRWLALPARIGREKFSTDVDHHRPPDDHEDRPAPARFVGEQPDRHRDPDQRCADLDERGEEGEPAEERPGRDAGEPVAEGGDDRFGDGASHHAAHRARASSGPNGGGAASRSCRRSGRRTTWRTPVTRSRVSEEDAGEDHGEADLEDEERRPSPPPAAPRPATPLCRP